jgi:RsiW-degrading membrane proteinase PrsW (M82 family)
MTGLLLDALKPSEPMLLRVFYEAFIVAALNEEALKFMAFMIFIWNDRNFNENFDGIVYAVFISLGFAGIENILYVIQGGIGTGILRAFTSVPGHALDGVFMGYFLARAKFNPALKYENLFLAFIVPFLLHGIWDFLIFLIRDNQGPGLFVGIFLLFFILFVVSLYLFGIRRINRSVASSQFRKSD